MNVSINTNQYSKVILGTAQFGLDYGIHGEKKIDYGEVEKILSLASENGIDKLDTAMEYGSSESVLGEIGVSNWNIITKISPLPAEIKDLNYWVKKKVSNSFERLRIEKLDTILLHNANDLIGKYADQLFSALFDLKENKLVSKIGVSVYSPEVLKKIQKRYSIDVVQAPLNILDRRIESKNIFLSGKSKKPEIHARSIFLKGLLLTAVEEMPSYFNQWRDLFLQLDNWRTDNRLERLEMCIKYVFSKPVVKKVVVGFHSSAHLIDFINVLNKFKIKKNWINVEASSVDRLINPYLWEL